MTLEVLDGGLLTTVQDRGRPGLGHLGVPTGGAADAWSHGVANLLVGNDPGAATLEATLVGPTLRAIGDVLVGLAGADLGAAVGPPGQAVEPGRSIVLRAGDVLSLPGPPRGGGLRAYVSVAGGIDVSLVLGSRSTCLVAGFGGLAGRPLRAGDLVPTLPAADRMPAAWPGPPVPVPPAGPDGTFLIRIADGPVASRFPLDSRRWRVAPASDRMGVRLVPADVDHDASDGPPEITTHGVVAGSIQVPPDGRPIVLLADHQPTGGYPVAGVVIAADLPALGQVAPGDVLRFERVDLDAARRALVVRRRAFDDAAARFRADTRWEDLWQSAGG